MDTEFARPEDLALLRAAFDTGESGFAGWVRHWAEGRPWFDAT